MKTTIKITSLFLVLGLLMCASAFAAETGATVTASTAVNGSNSDATNVTIDAGDVQEVNVSGISITTKWAGFYGNIAGGIALTDGTNDFYNWTVTNVSGAVVYAVNGTVSTWTLSAAANIDMPGYVNGTGVDDFDKTYLVNEQFDSPSKTVGSALYATTIGSGLKTYALKDNLDTLVWAGLAQHDGTGFDGSTVDYQLLVPAQTGTIYNFYMELP